jgi:hypothetical protein
MAKEELISPPVTSTTKKMKHRKLAIFNLCNTFSLLSTSPFLAVSSFAILLYRFPNCKKTDNCVY